MKKFLRGAVFIAGMISLTDIAVAGCLVSGPNNAKVKVEEYADFQCPYCVRGTNTVKQLAKDYGDRVQLIYRNAPLEFHSHAMTAAKAYAAVCMQSPKLASTYQDEIFSHQEELQSSDKVLFDTAEKIGVDVTKMKTDMESQKVADEIAADLKAFDDHGFKGTPSFVFNSETVSGALPYDDLKQYIDRNLGK